MTKAGRKGVGHYVALVFTGVAVIVYLIPIYWIIAASLKSPGDIIATVPRFVFRVTLENYQKLMPPEIPGVAYAFILAALAGVLLFLLPPQNKETARRMALGCNATLVLLGLYAFITTTNYNFLMLVAYVIIACVIIAPWRAANLKRIRSAFVSGGVFAIVAVCVALADAGSKYFHQLLNSVIIGFGSTILAVGFGTFSAYAFSRFRIAGKEDLLFFILSTRMLPPVVVVIPIYLMYTALGLRDTHFGLILLYTTFNVSFAVWLMKGFIDEIPREYEDAALVDGYTRFQTFLKVVLPQSVTGIAATAVFCLITAWNEFAFALVLTEVGGRAVTAPPSITSATGSGGIDWGKIAAATFVFLLPVAVFTFLMRRHLLRGVTFGAVKK
jgi:ABC-type glycerol-3-phosphate transport system permease component